MSVSSSKWLREYLAQLAPEARALLMRGFERAIERGEDVNVAELVLEQLRKIVRGDADNAAPRVEDPMRVAFVAVEPFLVDAGRPASPGCIRRSSLAPIWIWLIRNGAPDQVRALQTALNERTAVDLSAEIDAAVRKLQAAAADAIAEITDANHAADRSRALGRIGAPSVVEDLASIGSVFRVRETFDIINLRLPGFMRNFAEPQVKSISGMLTIPSLQNPQTLPFALTLVMQRLAEPWQIVRLGISMAGSDDELRIAATPYGVAVTMAIDSVSESATALQQDIRRGSFTHVSNHLKKLHDGLRGLRTEIDFRADSAWGRKLISIRAEISKSLDAEIEGVPGRVRRLLRQRPDKEITANTSLDSLDVEETAYLIDFVALCRNYASELAVNEVTLRTYNELQHYIEKSTETLVESLRGGESHPKSFRRMQVKAAIRFCEVLFGRDYAALMTKAADMAAAGGRPAARAG